MTLFDVPSLYLFTIATPPALLLFTRSFPVNVSNGALAVAAVRVMLLPDNAPVDERLATVAAPEDKAPVDVRLEAVKSPHSTAFDPAFSVLLTVT